MACFHDDACFDLSGAGTPARDRAQLRAALSGLFEAFTLSDFQEHCRVIDPPRAAVHWRGRFHAKSGQVAETDILDVIEVSDGRISSLATFFDTALVARLTA